VEVPSTRPVYEVGSAKNPRPPYPPAAFMARIEGRVIVKVHVLANGKAAEVQLVQTSGSSQLDKSALETLAKWELQPARKNGEAIDQWIEIPIHFRVLQK
jgi:periplasmic protein TonB